MLAVLDRAANDLPSNHNKEWTKRFDFWAKVVEYDIYRWSSLPFSLSGPEYDTCVWDKTESNKSLLF